MANSLWLISNPYCQLKQICGKCCREKAMISLSVSVSVCLYQCACLYTFVAKYSYKTDAYRSQISFGYGFNKFHLNIRIIMCTVLSWHTANILLFLFTLYSATVKSQPVGDGFSAVQSSAWIILDFPHAFNPTVAHGLNEIHPLEIMIIGTTTNKCIFHQTNKQPKKQPPPILLNCCLCSYDLWSTVQIRCTRENASDSLVHSVKVVRWRS